MTADLNHSANSEPSAFRDATEDEAVTEVLTGARSFPGGTVKLPLLNSVDPDEIQFSYVGTAFVRASADDAAPLGADNGAFTEYFTPESLFLGTDAEEEESKPLGAEDPYRVLHVTPDASWSEITSSHRALVKEFHPDRFVDFPESIVKEAEIEIRRINTAYTTLRKIHHAS